MRVTSGRDSIDDFLSDFEGRTIDWARPEGTPVGIDTVEVLYGRGDRPLEVAVAHSNLAPKSDDLRRLWKTRANRGAPVLLVILHPDKGALAASVIGTDGDPTPLSSRSAKQIERIARAALEEPNRHQAARTLDRSLGSLSRDGLAAGLLNSGLFASHQLRKDVPKRSDWEHERVRSLPLLGKTGRALLEGLGFSIEARGSALLALAGEGTTQHAIAVILDEDESFDRTSQRFGGVSPISRALAQAQQERLPWVVALRRNQIRLYPADPDIGVGRKGLTETYAELDLMLLDDAEAGYLALLFSPEALERGGYVDQIIHDSSIYANELGARLRQRIYEDVVPELAVAVARRMGAQTEQDLEAAYHRTLVILFRLLFVAYAEDRGLLPFERNERYTRNALKTYARDFVRDPRQEFSSQSTSIWEDLVQVWNAIDTGEPRWDVPAYNGGLFSTDPQTHPDGAAVSALSLTNAEVGPALTAMLVDTDAEGLRGPVDFRSLSVREFGTIYEGLLESSLSFAPSDLALDRNQTFLPARDGENIVVRAGEVYFHNASGQRKSTGSYFTKSFAVEHLLDTALEPALDDHLARVATLIAEDDTGRQAAAAFFDFRVADIAMGSGHFLVAAIDRIEARFSAFLAEHPLQPITDELIRLETAARTALGEQGKITEIEPSLLLRRQIARRCIYGLDINLIAVELARLGIWIHTFVPGLPMSSLDHGLVHGNSLTGMGTIDGALKVLAPETRAGQLNMFSVSIGEALERSRATLLKVAQTSEATKQEVQDAADEYRRANEEAADARQLMDAAVAVRLGLIPIPIGPDEAIESITADTGAAQKARAMLTDLAPAHFPVLFPEVFLRERSGFDVILGNPPWDKVRFEAQQFWVTRVPGFNALTAGEREMKMAAMRQQFAHEAEAEQREEATRERLQKYFSRGFSHQGRGHFDYSKLFTERAVTLLRSAGCLGYVLPRQCLVLGGWSNLRALLLEDSQLEVVQARNRGGWFFEDVDHRYMVVLLSRRSGTGESRVVTWPSATCARQLRHIRSTPSIALTREELADLTITLVVPWFETPEGVEVFNQMRSRPRLSSGEGWIQGVSETRWDFSGSGQHRRYAHSEELESSWSILMTRHIAPFEIAREIGFQKYVTESYKLAALENGVVMEESRPILGESHPAIVYRYPSRNDDARTVVAAGLPAEKFLPSTGYAHTIRHPIGTPKESVLALLGYLNSRVCDWWARRIVDRHVTAPVVNGLPLPDWNHDDVWRVSRLTAALLLRAGVERLAGGIQLEEEDAGTVGLTTAELAVLLDKAAFEGFGLSQERASVVLEDFTERGYDLGLRSALLDSMGSGQSA